MIDWNFSQVGRRTRLIGNEKEKILKGLLWLIKEMLPSCEYLIKLD